MATPLDNCEIKVPFQKIPPRKPVSYEFSNKIAEFFGAGYYPSYETIFADAGFLTEITAYKFVYGREDFVQYLVEELSRYISAWKQCIAHHEHRENTTCYNPSFRAMLYKGINEIESALREKIPVLKSKLNNFDRAVEFVEAWNELQHTMMVTYYANLIAFPGFLKHEKCLWDDKLTCAMCSLNDRIIQSPTPNFLFLSGFFTPDDFYLPSEKRVEQGVYVYEKAESRALIHEHAHAYMHLCRRGDQQVLCDYLDEGFAEWCAIAIGKPAEVYKSIFREKYDFWIVLNSLPSTLAMKLFNCYISSCDSINWSAFVRNGIEAIILHREKNRSRRFWANDEKLEPELVRKIVAEIVKINVSQTCFQER